MLRPMLLAALAAAALAPGAPARAAVIDTFDFAGICADCVGTATAQLRLADYAVGTPVAKSNFVSLTYAGTNLVRPFTLTAADVTTVTGALNPPFPGAQDFIVTSDNQVFSTFSFGYWCVGTTPDACTSDMGDDHAWSLATVSDVPEPVSAALLGTGFLAVAIGRRRRP